MQERSFRLCLVLSREPCRLPPLRVLEESVRGGADLVQLREKRLAAREFAAWTEDALAACRALGVPLLVNDSVEIAAACGADGVHLGQDDLAPEDARRILGARALIGWSTHSDAQLEAAAAQRDSVDYAGFGPAFATATKGYTEGLSPRRIQSAVRLAAERKLPLLIIGGITQQNRALLGPLGGAAGLAVSSALCGAEDPRAVAAALLRPADAPSHRTLG